jgi:hypothetical protein
LEQQQKKIEAVEETWKDRAKELFSPKITKKGKEIKRKAFFSPPRDDNSTTTGQNAQNDFKLNSSKA